LGRKVKIAVLNLLSFGGFLMRAPHSIRFRVFYLTLAVFALAASAPAGPAAAQDLALNRKVNALLAKMTLDEKIGQMVQYNNWATASVEAQDDLAAGRVGSFLNTVGAKNTNELQKIAVEQSRLHIPILFGLDVIHGYKTIFPIPLAEDCAFNPDLLAQCESAAAHEASAAGIRWTFAPMVDVTHEPRWGRVAEGSGEDPYLGSVLAAARVKGFQGATLSDPGSIAACAKHYVGYGAVEAGREYNTTDISDETLWNLHLPPFKAALDAGARTFMSAFNDLNGVPASGNAKTLRGILKGQWAFQGFVVSDWDSVKEMVVHGYAADEKDATLKGLLAGVDMDMHSKVYSQNLAALVKEKKVPLALINDSVRRILKVKFELGLFDHPYTDETQEDAAMMTEASRTLAQQEAEQSAVLLKNDKNILPLSKSLKTIAVIGALADSKIDPLGPWHCQGEKVEDQVITVLKGIQDKLDPSARVLYAPGVDITQEDAPQSLIDQAVDTAKQAQVAVVVAGERQSMSGEAESRTSLNLPGRQEEMIQAIEKTGVPVVLVLMNGRPLTIPWEADHVPAILESWFLGVEQGAAVADLLFGDANPCGKLAVTFPSNLGQVPIYYNHFNTGRPYVGDPNNKWCSKYIDSPNSPLYPFGFGLSYTSFDYSNLVCPAKVDVKGVLKVTADVKNSGAAAGVEIVQLYIRQEAASLIQPVRRLMDFKRVELKPGESQSVEFDLPASKLAYFDEKGKPVLEPGHFQLWVSKNSADDTLPGGFELAGGALSASARALTQ
jgi:beta-glucosidase